MSGATRTKGKFSIFRFVVRPSLDGLRCALFFPYSCEFFWFYWDAVLLLQVRVSGVKFIRDASRHLRAQDTEDA